LPTQLLRRKTDSHKNDYGHILVLAGSEGLTGAACLSSMAALRSGAGVVTLGIPKSLNSIMEAKTTEVMTKPLSETSQKSLSLLAKKEILKLIPKIDCIALGPGLSVNAQTKKLVRELVAGIKKPMVVDADGLNALVGNLKIFKKGLDRIFTPHPGELARLLGVSSQAIQKNRKNIAISFAKKYNTVIVLKGNNTVVASYDGKTYVNKTGNSGMATAGSGDVLTGIVAAFLAQGLSCFDAAKYAVYAHGLSGDIAAKNKTQLGLIATDILDSIPAAIKCSLN